MLVIQFKKNVLAKYGDFLMEEFNKDLAFLLLTVFKLHLQRKYLIKILTT